jgi:sigma-54 specific flagellar transcriptional regulator A
MVDAGGMFAPVLAAAEMCADAYRSPELPPEGLDLKAYLDTLEIGYIRQALERSNNVVSHACQLLGMRRTTLVEKMRKFGIQRGLDAPES